MRNTSIIVTPLAEPALGTVQIRALQNLEAAQREKALQKLGPPKIIEALQGWKQVRDERAARARALSDGRPDFLVSASREDRRAYDTKLDDANGDLDQAESIVVVLTEYLVRAQAAAKDAEDAEARDRVQARVDALNAKAPEIRAALALLAWAAPEERWCYEQLGTIKRDAPPGTDLPEPPLRALRYSPAATPLATLGIVIKTRAKDLRNTLRIGGPDAYESYEAPAELPPFNPEVDFDPPPLFRTMEIPRFRRDDPFYRIPPDQKW